MQSLSIWEYGCLGRPYRVLTTPNASPPCKTSIGMSARAGVMGIKTTLTGADPMNALLQSLKTRLNAVMNVPCWTEYLHPEQTRK